MFFGKAFRILGLDERKGQWNKIFMEMFGSMVFAVSMASLSEWSPFCYGLKDLFTLYKLADKLVLDH